MNKALKRFLFANMYYSFRVVSMKKRAQRFIEQMFRDTAGRPAPTSQRVSDWTSKTATLSA